MHSPNPESVELSKPLKSETSFKDQQAIKNQDLFSDSTLRAVFFHIPPILVLKQASQIKMRNHNYFWNRPSFVEKGYEFYLFLLQHTNIR